MLDVAVVLFGLMVIADAIHPDEVAAWLVKWKEWIDQHIEEIDTLDLCVSAPNVFAPTNVSNPSRSNHQFFNLSGRRVSRLTKGIYIKDGRKVA